MKRIIKPKFFYFDLAGVLFDICPAYVCLAKKTGLSLEKIREIWFKFDNAACLGQLSSEAFWDAIKKETKYDINLGMSFDEFRFSLYKPILTTHRLNYSSSSAKTYSQLFRWYLEQSFCRSVAVYN